MSEYQWESGYGTYAVHEGSGVVFAIGAGGSGESIAGPGVGREILRLRAALAAERERCARICISMADNLGKADAKHFEVTINALFDAADFITKLSEHPTAPASGTDPGPAER